MVEISLDDLVGAIKCKPEWLDKRGRRCDNCLNYEQMAGKPYGCCKMRIEHNATVSEWYYCSSYRVLETKADVIVY
jgi:hypothetical protein